MNAIISDTISTEFDSRGCYSFRKICTVAFPILLSVLVEYIIGLTDTAFLGRVSEVALGASAMGSVYILIFFVLGGGFSFGAQILIARRNGEKDHHEIGRICFASGFFLIVLSLVLIAAARYFTPVLLPHIIRSSNVCDATLEYIDWRIYGLFFVFTTAIFRSFYVGIARTKILTYSSIAMVLSNVILNYGLIFGKYGLPEMGIGGAALASTIAEGIALLFFVFYTWKYVDLVKYGMKKVPAFFDLDILKKVFRISAWMMLQSFLSISIWFVFFIAVERLGERSLAVINLVRSFSGIAFLIIHSFAITANSLVSNLIGENKADLVWRLVGKIILLATAILTPLLIFATIFPEWCLRIYTDSPDLIAATVNVVYVMCIGSLMQIIAFILFNTVSGTGAVRMTVLIETAALLIYLLYVWLVIIRQMPSPAVAWGSEIVYQLFAMIFSLVYLGSGKWRNKKI